MDNTLHLLQWAVDTAPVGVWQTAAGTFDVVSQSRFVFSADGTGEVLDGNAFGFSISSTFEWVHQSPGKLKIFVLDPGVSESENTNEKANRMNWETITYTADTIETDVGAIAVLRDVEPSFPDSFPIAFWGTNNPITLVSAPVEP